MNSIYSVGQVNNYIKNMFQQDFLLNKVSIKVKYQIVSIIPRTYLLFIKR